MSDAVPDGVVAHPTNADQARVWNEGDDGRRFVEHADRLDRSIAAYGTPFTDAANVAAAEHVLDVGCGSGRTTIDAARAAARGSAVGIDLSAPLLELARARARDANVGNVAFVHADAQVHDFEASTFDVAISRMGAMFFGDPVAAFRNVARALVRGGRLTLLAWQPFDRQEWLRELTSTLSAGRDRPPPPAGVPGPFGLADPARARAILDRAGDADVTVEGVHAPMWFGDDVDQARDLVLAISGWMLDGLDDAARARALEALRTSLAEHATPDGVRYGSATWLVRARRA